MFKEIPLLVNHKEAEVPESNLQQNDCQLDKTGNKI